MKRRCVSFGFVVAMLSVGCVLPASADVRRGELVSNRKATLFAFDRKTGERVWRRIVTDHPAHLGLLYAAKGKLIAIETPCGGSGSASLVAFDQSTGEEAWRSKLNESFENEIRVGPRDFGPGGTPVLVRTSHVANNAVEPDPLQAFDPETGELVWEADLPRTITAGGGDDVAVLYNWSSATPPPVKVFGVDRRTGKTLWTYSVIGDHFGVNDAQVGTDSVQLVTTSAFDQRLAEGVVLDLATGAELWRTKINYDARLAQPLGGVNGDVDVSFSPAPEHHISAVDVRTREQLWERDDRLLDAGFIPGMVDRMLGFPGGRIVAIDMRSGRDLWSRTVEGSSSDDQFYALGRLTGGNKGLIVFESPKGIHAIDAATGKTRWITKVNARDYTPTFGKYVYITEDCHVA